MNCSKYRGEYHMTNLQMTFCIVPSYTNHISWEFTFSQIPEMTIFSFGAGVLGSALNVISWSYTCTHIIQHFFSKCSFLVRYKDIQHIRLQNKQTLAKHFDMWRRVLRGTMNTHQIWFLSMLYISLNLVALANYFTFKISSS